MPAPSIKPDISIILCTCNPRLDVLENVLKALSMQMLEKDRWELIVVDNNSNPALNIEWFKEHGSFDVRLIQEPKPGVPWGRAR
jgi:glycosyltransferase involved in cell wall biosynthesis